MDWLDIANTDWYFYHDPERIQQYVNFGKITQEQADEITKI